MTARPPRPASPPVSPPAGPLSASPAAPTLHRSGAVARMLRMPVATLRVWERRYGLTPGALTPSGQRLYGADDVRRLALLRQLTELGHAIGSLAGLDMAALQQVAATHARALLVSRDQAGEQPAGAEPADLAELGDVGHARRASAPPRRWDDAALADFAGLSSTVACECPRHLAELLMRLTQFEDYSAQCEQRSPADARLHAHLRQVTAQARAQFERALERVAVHEGLVLPGAAGT